MCSTNTKYQIGDKVFAKVTGYAHWPAKIDNIVRSGKSETYKVIFYGPLKEIADLKENKISSYEENKSKYGVPKKDNPQNRHFNEALLEADMDPARQKNHKIDNSTAEEDLFILDPFKKNNPAEPHTSYHTPKGENVQTDDNQLNCSITELEQSLVESNLLENSAEDTTKLEMAAKIGSALLVENNLLKEKNLRLQADFLLLEEKIDTLRANELKHIETAERLQDQLIATENQLKKEMQLRTEAQNIFEEHDSKLQLLLNEHVKKAKDQQKIITSLKDSIKNHDTTLKNIDKEHTSKKTQNVEEKVHDDSTTPQPNSFLLNELVQLKIRQGRVESSVNTLEKQFNQITNPKGLAIPNTVTLKNPTSCFANSSTGKKAGTPSKIKNNVFSISLQVNKFKDSSKTLKQQNEQNKTYGNGKSRHEAKTVSSTMLRKTSLDSEQTDPPRAKIVNTHYIKSPPTTAMQLKKGESWEVFFEKNLEHFKTVNENYLKAISHNKSGDKIQTSFLGSPTKPLTKT